jgi:type VI secretion system protein ImpE
MTATEHFQAGDLRAALDAQLAEVRARPADQGRRTFLFELASLAGDWDRARKQIDAVTYDDPERQATAATYRQLLDAEDHRRRVFADGVMPQFLVPPPEWVFPRLEAVAALKAGDRAAAKGLLDRSDADAPPVTLTISGRPAEGVRDCDDRLGPVLEVLSHGGYFWLPLEQLDGLTGLPPQYPRDTVWFPVKLSVKDGPAGDAFIPCRYFGSESSADDAVRLGRETRWDDAPGGPVTGLGLRTFLAGDEAVAVTDLREWLAR